MSVQQETSKEPRSLENPVDTQDLPERRSSRRAPFKRLVAALVLLTGIIAVGGFLLQIKAHAPRADSIARVGKPLPAILVSDDSGQMGDVGKVGLGARTVIVFYSTSCEVCQQEIPKLKPFPASLRLIMVNEDSHSSEELDKLGLRYTRHFYDRDRVFERLSLNPGLPTILLVDEHAVLRKALVGAHTAEVLQGRLAEFAASGSGAD